MVCGDITTIPGLPESLGFLPLDESDPPTPPPGYHEEARYAVLGGRIVQTWEEVVDPPAPPRIFSKLKLKLALATGGYLAAVKELLAGIDVAPGYSAAEAFADATNIAENHPGFAAAVGAAKQTLGVTDEQVEAVLAASVVD